MSTAVPIVRGDGEGERLWFAGGGVWTMKATAAETDGAFTLLEDRLMRGKTTPLHIYPNLDETLIVLDGEILVHSGGSSIGSAGAVSRWPRAAFRTRSWSPRRPHASSRCRRQEAAGRSTGTRPSRRPPRPTRGGRPTGSSTEGRIRRPLGAPDGTTE